MTAKKCADAPPKAYALGHVPPFALCYVTVLKTVSTGLRIHSFMYLFFVLIIKENSFTILSR